MPDVYYRNGKSTRLRDSNFSDSFEFAAADDTAARAIAAVVDAHCKSKTVSLNKRMQASSLNVNHPEGSRVTLKAYLIAADRSVCKVTCRNVKVEASIRTVTNLLLGASNDEDGFEFPALSSPTYLPNSGQETLVVQPSLTYKT